MRGGIRFIRLSPGDCAQHPLSEPSHRTGRPRDDLVGVLGEETTAFSRLLQTLVLVLADLLGEVGAVSYTHLTLPTKA